MNATLPNHSTVTAAVLDRVRSLRTELADLAFALERRGRFDAADAINAVVPRLAEIEDLAAMAESHSEEVP